MQLKDGRQLEGERNGGEKEVGCWVADVGESSVYTVCAHGGWEIITLTLLACRLPWMRQGLLLFTVAHTKLAAPWASWASHPPPPGKLSRQGPSMYSWLSWDLLSGLKFRATLFHLLTPPSRNPGTQLFLKAFGVIRT